MRIILVGATNGVAYFTVWLLDGVTPALGEAGNQPEVSINGAAFGPTGISILTSVGFGRYTAVLNPIIITTPGDIILTRYRGAATLESDGGDFQVIDANSLEPHPTTQAINVLSYATVNEGNTYFNENLNSQAWLGATSSDQLKAVRQATKIIDRLNFVGAKTNSAQLLQFPRGGDKDVPADIQIASLEIAIRLLDGVDPELEIEAIMAESHGFGNVKVSYNRSFIPEHLLAGVPSAKAWTYLLPYLVDPRSVIMSKVT